MDKQPPIETWNDPAIEARVVAWVMGEASEFEAAEVRRLIAEYPELAAFARRIQAVHELLGEAASPEKSQSPWAMSKERREMLEMKLGPLDAVPAGAVAAAGGKSRAPWYRRMTVLFPTMSAAAAVMLVGLVSLYNMGGCSTDIREMAVAESSADYEPPELPNSVGLSSFPVTPATPVNFLDEEEESSGPILGDLPIIGRLFRSGDKEAEVAMVPLQTDLPRELSVGTPKDVSHLVDPSERHLLSEGARRAQKERRSNVGGRELASAKRTADSKDGRRDDVAAASVDPFAPALAAEGTGWSVDPFSGRAKNDFPAVAAMEQLAPAPEALDAAVMDAFALTPAPESAPAQPAASSREVVAAPPTLKLEEARLEQFWSADESQKAQVNAGETWFSNRPGGGGAGGALGEGSSRSSQVGTRSVGQDFEVALAEPPPPPAEFEGFLNYGSPVVSGDMSNGVPVGGDAFNANARSANQLADAKEGGLRRDLGAELGLRSGDAVVTRGLIDGLLKEVDETWETSPEEKPVDANAREEALEEAKKKKEGEEAQSRFRPEAKRELLESEEAAVSPVSTFSLFVSDASFRQAAAALLRENRLPDPVSVRTEDFVNAFHYGDPSPGLAEAVACAVDQGAHPFVPGRNLVRLGVTTASSGRGDGQPLRLTIALDSSGSMERPDRAKVVDLAMEKLAGQLTDADVVSLVTFARQPRLQGDRLQGEAARAAVRGLAQAAPPEGGTNLEAALDLIEQIAMRNPQPGAMNRVVLITDGAANLGNTDPEALGERIAGLRARGIFFDVCGVGTSGLDDKVLEALSRRGDGRYLVLDAEDRDAGARFARELAGAFRPAAVNVKVQVRFNPERVGRYQLLGFEKHMLREQDFKDDSVSAASMAAAEQGNAVYQVELLPQGRGDVGEVAVRFLDVASNRMVERRWPIPFDVATPAPDLADAPTRLAVTAALLAEALRGTPVGRTVDVSRLRELAAPLRVSHRDDPTVGTLLQMLEKTESLMK